MGPSRQTILAVDDFAAVTEMLAALLSHCDVHRARTATAALRMARERGYDLYVLDFGMPDMSGGALCRAVREIDPNAPVVVYSGWPEPREHAGWTTWFEKGWDVARLVERIEALLHEQRVLNESAERIELDAIAAEVAAHEQDADARMAALSERVAQTGERIRASWARHCARDDIRRAFQAYATAGGTRSSFEAYWSELLGERAGQAAAYAAPAGR